ncbi:MAG TPA: chromate transporter [Stellaceae bacterium]|nr:chromate transporter [Stellaceae bacterium]
MASAPARLASAQIFRVFFRAGWGFGGGLAVLALLEEELVTRRRLMSRADLITLWSIGRIVPCGTMTAVAVAIGWRLGGLPGSVAALTAMILPGFVCTVALAAGYAVLGHGPALGYVRVTLIPAALGLILVSALRIGREIPVPSPELALAAAAFVAAIGFRVNPTLLLVGGGVVGALLLRGPTRGKP